MPRINLLPWREQQRRERKLAFFVALGVAAGAAGAASLRGQVSVASGKHFIGRGRRDRGKAPCAD